MPDDKSEPRLPDRKPIGHEDCVVRRRAQKRTDGVRRVVLIGVMLATSGCVAEPGTEPYDARPPYYGYDSPWDYGPSYYPSERYRFYGDRGRDRDRDHGRASRDGPPMLPGLPKPPRPFGHFP
jgi:hypothetical protein